MLPLDNDSKIVKFSVSGNFDVGSSNLSFGFKTFLNNDLNEFTFILFDSEGNFYHVQMKKKRYHS